MLCRNKEKNKIHSVVLAVIKCNNIEKSIGGFFMKIKSISTLVLVGVFALSVGSLKDLQSTEVLAQNDQPKVEAVQAFSNEGDVIRVVTAEEKNKI